MATFSKATYNFETEQISHYPSETFEAPTNEKMLHALAKDYAKYVNVDFTQREKVLEDSIEEMLLRLDEFITLIDMVRSDNSQCLNRTLIAIYNKLDGLSEMKEKIDKLETFVKIVDKNLNVMEGKVILAEQELRKESSLEKVFKPFFKKDSPTQQNKPRSKLVYEQPEILKMVDYFHSHGLTMDVDETVDQQTDALEGLDEACALSPDIL